MHQVFELQASMNAEGSDKTTTKRKIKIEMKKIGYKSSILSPITGFRMQNPFRKPLEFFFSLLKVIKIHYFLMRSSFLRLIPLKQIIHNNSLLDAATIGVIVKPVGGDEGEVNVFLVFGQFAHPRHPVTQLLLIVAVDDVFLVGKLDFAEVNHTVGTVDDEVNLGAGSALVLGDDDR